MSTGPERSYHRTTRMLAALAGAVGVALGVAFVVVLGQWFFLPVEDGCATSEPIPDGGSVVLETSVGTKAGVNHLPVLDVNGAWYSAPLRVVDGESGSLTDLPAGDYSATISRSGSRLTMSIGGQTVPLRSDGRCFD